jgi:mono/diheme cytochrome c family protein
MLAGRLKETAPFSWDGNHGDLEKHVTETFHRLNGMGGVRSVELEALVAYIESLPAPPRTTTSDPALVARGRHLFAAADTGCAGCHTGSHFTDNAKHDVSSRARGDRADRFNTPSLAHLSGRGPWFHDGRYQSLRQLLVAESGKMGRTAHLSERDLNALEAYLRSL